MRRLILVTGEEPLRMYQSSLCFSECSIGRVVAVEEPEGLNDLKEKYIRIRSYGQ